MDSPHRPEDDPLLGHVVRRFAPEDAGDPADPCPGDNLLMSLAGGKLLGGERENLEAHLARCERCRGVAEILSRADAAGAGRASLGLKIGVAAAAASILAAAVIFGPERFPGVETRASAGTEERLFAAAADLGRARPELFGGFDPLSREERLARGPELRAGDLALLYPSGKIFDTRPAFRWEAAADREDEIVLRTARGDTLWRGTAKPPLLEYPVDAPDLVPGVRYAWEVSREGRRIFATASEEERKTFETASAEIESRVPSPIRALLLAHLALRGEFFAEAERAARAYVALEPADAVGRETLAHVLRRLGSSEAERMASEGTR
jgi:hypothetical protein